MVPSPQIPSMLEETSIDEVTDNVYEPRYVTWGCAISAIWIISCLASIAYFYLRLSQTSERIVLGRLQCADDCSTTFSCEPKGGSYFMGITFASRQDVERLKLSEVCITVLVGNETVREVQFNQPRLENNQLWLHGEPIDLDGKCEITFLIEATPECRQVFNGALAELLERGPK